MSPFTRYLTGSAGPPGLWRVVGGLTVTVLAYMLVTVSILGIIGGLRGTLEPFGSGGISDIAVLLASFVGIWIGLEVALAALHDRSLDTVLGPPSGSAAALGLLLGAGAYGVGALLATMALGLPARSAVPVGDWLGWLPLLGALVVVQAGAEELVFRGYLLQEIARRAPHPAAWAGIPALAFGLLHYAPGLPGWAAGLYVVVTGLFGLAAALLVGLSGSLWPAIGLHVGLNIAGLTLVGVSGRLDATQLWLYPAAETGTALAADLVAMGVLLAVVVALRRVS